MTVASIGPQQPSLFFHRLLLCRTELAEIDLHAPLDGDAECASSFSARVDSAPGERTTSLSNRTECRSGVPDRRLPHSLQESRYFLRWAARFFAPGPQPSFLRSHFSYSRAFASTAGPIGFCFSTAA